jgi:hypothetical protein
MHNGIAAPVAHGCDPHIPSPIISILDMDHSRLTKANGLAADRRNL